MFHLFGGIGGLLILIAQVWVAVVAFRQGVLWGLAVLCIPFVAFVFIFLNWEETKGAVVLYVLGALLGGWGTRHRLISSREPVQRATLRA